MLHHEQVSQFESEWRGLGARQWRAVLAAHSSPALLHIFPAARHSWHSYPTLQSRHCRTLHCSTGNKCWNGSATLSNMHCSALLVAQGLVSGKLSQSSSDTGTLYCRTKQREGETGCSSCSAAALPARVAPAPQPPRSPVRHGARWLVSREPPELAHHLLNAILGPSAFLVGTFRSNVSPFEPKNIIKKMIIICSGLRDLQC